MYMYINMLAGNDTVGIFFKRIINRIVLTWELLNLYIQFAFYIVNNVQEVLNSSIKNKLSKMSGFTQILQEISNNIPK